MTTEAPSLLQGDAAAQWRFTLQAILSDALRLVRTLSIDGLPAGQHDLDRALQLVRDISAELRLLDDDQDVPF